MKLSSYRYDRVVRQEGGIQGLGLFATRDIEQGELLAIKGGRLVDTDTLTDNLEIINGSHVQVAPDIYITGLTKEEIDNTLIGYNHSCDPNAYIHGQIEIKAMKGIKKGDEVTIDYATGYTTSNQFFKCLCNSPNCRKYIDPSKDSKDSNIISAYNGYLADFLADPKAYEALMTPIDSSCPITSWLNTKLKRISSNIHGTGLITTQPVSKDEILALRGGYLANSRYVNAHQDILMGSEVQIEEGVFLVGLNEQEHQATMMGFNHSCESNCYARGQIGVAAMRDINVGEELTVEYATAYISESQGFKCNCGSKSCRHFIDTQNDWKDVMLQGKHRGYFRDFIQRRIDNLRTP